MTDEEHMARALLLGRVYDWRDHTYCYRNELDDNELTADGAIDADKLEPIDIDKLYDRMKSRGGLNKDWRARS